MSERRKIPKPKRFNTFTKKAVKWLLILGTINGMAPFLLSAFGLNDPPKMVHRSTEATIRNDSQKIHYLSSMFPEAYEEFVRMLGGR